MRILPVEDDVIAALVAADALMAGEHEVVGPAFSVDDALELAASNLLDLALVDIGLAGRQRGYRTGSRTACPFRTAFAVCQRARRRCLRQPRRRARLAAQTLSPARPGPQRRIRTGPGHRTQSATRRKAGCAGSVLVRWTTCLLTCLLTCGCRGAAAPWLAARSCGRSKQQCVSQCDFLFVGLLKIII